MSWSRIKGILCQEAYITKHESTIWFDLLIMSTMSVLVFGFLSRYLAGSNPIAGTYVIMGMILWEIIRVNQYCISVNSLWNLWSHNLSNIFVSPISLTEYVIGNCILALIKTSAVVTVIAIMGNVVFNFNILSLGLATLFFVALMLTVFAWGLGWLLLGLIFRYGTSVQALAWGAIFFVQPVSAVYFPVHVLPVVMQWIGWAFPSTYAFEAARHAIAGGGTSWHLIGGGLILDVVWFAIGIKGFSWLFHRSRMVGQFARNDS